MKNEMMTNGCSKDHTKEGPMRGPTGDQATRKKRTLGATSPQTWPRKKYGRKEKRKRRNDGNSAGQGRTGSNSPGEEKGKE